ncbi:MAG: helix-turn-helix domain-containing protein [Victivallales bacterium]
MNNIQVIERTFKILEIVSDARETTSKISELSEKTGLKVPTVSRIVRTLSYLGYMESVGRKKGYTLGNRLVELSRNYKCINPLRNISVPLLQKFRNQIGEFICVSVLKNNQRHVIHIEEPTHTIQVTHVLPEIEGPYQSVGGRILMSGLSRKQQEKCFEYNGLPGKAWDAVTDLETFYSELDKISQKKYLLEYANGTARVAMAIKSNGETCAAVGSYIPTYRFVGEYKGKVLRALEKISSEISEAIQNYK